MTFPRDYPFRPPGMLPQVQRRIALSNPLAEFRFLRPLFHPNIYPDGKLCISILHQPGEDVMSGELASERWSPAQRVESVLISILSLLDDAEVNSPANVDAGVMLRNYPEKYKERVKQDLEASKKDIPVDFVMPTTQVVAQKKEIEDHGFSWSDSEAEDDFGASDSDEEMMEDDDEEPGDGSPSDSDDEKDE